MHSPAPSAWMRISFPSPGFFINDPVLTIHVNGWCGIGRSRTYTVMATHGQAVEVMLDYSRFWGNFTEMPIVRHVALGA